MERKRQEDAERQAKKEAADRQAKYDRRALYHFVGAEVPKNSNDYHQMFRLTYGGLDITSDGKRAIIARVHELSGKLAEAPEPAKTPELRIVMPLKD